MFEFVSNEKENELNLTREESSSICILKITSPVFTLEAVFFTELASPFTSIALVNSVIEVSEEWTVEVELI